MDFLLDFAWAFAVGGAFCVLAQILIDRTCLSPARILVGFVVAGVVLGGIGVYEPLAELAGAGATTPLTGFGYAIARGVREAVTQRGLLGAVGGGLSGCAAVISAVLGMSFVAALISRGKPK